LAQVACQALQLRTFAAAVKSFKRDECATRRSHDHDDTSQFACALAFDLLPTAQILSARIAWHTSHRGGDSRRKGDEPTFRCYIQTFD
jgi:hypothetical protein